MRAIVLFFLISGMLSACGGNNDAATNADKKINIVSTIKPIHSIVHAIVGDKADRHLLIPAYASPHHYNFRPSDIRKLKQADVVFRIDQHLETMLLPALSTLSSHTKIVTLSELDGLTMLKMSHAHNEYEDHDEEENIDLHIWTSPKNAQIIANKITDVLAKKNPDQAALYQKNLSNFSLALNQSTEEIRASLKTSKNKPYLVFHNSWQYFSDYFDLQAPTVIETQEGITKGVKTLSTVKKILRAGNIRCIFYDDSVADSQRKVLVDGLTVKTTQIDALMKNNSSSQFNYIEWLKQMSEDIQRCLSA